MKEMEEAKERAPAPELEHVTAARATLPSGERALPTKKKAFKPLANTLPSPATATKGSSKKS